MSWHFDTSWGGAPHRLAERGADHEQTGWITIPPQRRPVWRGALDLAGRPKWITSIPPPKNSYESAPATKENRQLLSSGS